MSVQIIPTLSEHTKADLLTILQRHGVVRAAIFGSVARKEAGPSSDLDLLVEFPGGKSLFDLVRLERDLSEAVGLKVDVVTYGSLHPLIKERILAEQVPIL